MKHDMYPKNQMHQGHHGMGAKSPKHAGHGRMKALAINCGSSTLKFQLIDVEGKDEVLGQMRRLAYGIIDRIGSRGAIEFTAENREPLRKATAVANYNEAEAIARCGWKRIRDNFLMPRLLLDELKLLRSMLGKHDDQGLGAKSTSTAQDSKGQDQNG